MKQKLQKVEELKRSLVSQQFTKAKSQSEAAVQASFIVTAEVAKSARCFGLTQDYVNWRPSAECVCGRRSYNRCWKQEDVAVLSYASLFRFSLCKTYLIHVRAAVWLNVSNPCRCIKVAGCYGSAVNRKRESCSSCESISLINLY